MSDNQFLDFFSEYSADPHVRMAYDMTLMKALVTLAFQLFFTFVSVLMVNTFDSLAYTVLENLQLFIYLGSFGALAVILYSSFMAREITDLHVLLFTVFETMGVCGFTVLYGRGVVILSVIVTFAITVGLFAFAITTKTNLTTLHRTLTSLLFVLLGMALINMFVRSNFIGVFELGLGTVVFMLYIIVDVQVFLMRECRLNPGCSDLANRAALNIYIDIINLFLRVVRIIQMLKDRDNNSRRRRDD